MIVLNWQVPISHPSYSFYLLTSLQSNWHQWDLMLRQYSRSESYWESCMWVILIKEVLKCKKFYVGSRLFKQMERSVRNDKSWHLRTSPLHIHWPMSWGFTRRSRDYLKNTAPSWPGGHLPEMEHDKNQVLKGQSGRGFKITRSIWYSPPPQRRIKIVSR